MIFLCTPLLSLLRSMKQRSTLPRPSWVMEQSSMQILRTIVQLTTSSPSIRYISIYNGYEIAVSGKFEGFQCWSPVSRRFPLSLPQMLSLQGNTAVYLLYAHARIAGIVRKVIRRTRNKTYLCESLHENV